MYGKNCHHTWIDHGFPAHGAEGGECLPPRTGTVAVVATFGTLGFVSPAAIGTTFGLISKAFSLVEFLFASGECESSTAIGTLY